MSAINISFDAATEAGLAQLNVFLQSRSYFIGCVIPTASVQFISDRDVAFHASARWVVLAKHDGGILWITSQWLEFLFPTPFLSPSVVFYN